MKFIKLALILIIAVLSIDSELLVEARPSSYTGGRTVRTTTSYVPGRTTIRSYGGYRPGVYVGVGGYHGYGGVYGYSGYGGVVYGRPLGAGAWVGIVLGIIAFIALIMCLSCWCRSSEVYVEPYYDETVVVHEPGYTQVTTEVIDHTPATAPIGPPPSHPPGMGPPAYCNAGHVM